MKNVVKFLLFCLVVNISYAQKSTFKADIDTAFSQNSGFFIDELSDIQVENLDILCKVWGFLKYYHPYIAKGNLNWDNELFRFLPSYVNVENKEERNDSLLSWVEKLNSVRGKGNKMTIKDNTKLTPQLQWLSDTNLLGSKLSNELIKTRNTKRSSIHYYFSFDKIVGNPIFKNERDYKSISLEDRGFRILTLFRYYNIIEYFYPNRHLIGEDWHNIPSEFTRKMFDAKSDFDAKKVILEIVTRINDSHAFTNLGDDFNYEFYGNNFANIKLSFIENTPVVSGYWNSNRILPNDLKVGDIITAINGENIIDRVEKLKKYTPASNESARMRDIAKVLLHSNSRGITVDYVRRGKSASQSLSCFNYNSLFDKSEQVGESQESTWRFITADIGYIYLGTLDKKDIPKMMGELRATKGIIIDLRCYPKDFVVFSLSKYFHISKTPFAKFSFNNAKNPGLFSLTKPISVLGEKDAYNGKLVILVNEQTQSQAEYTTMALRAASTATIVGSTTAGADGNISKIVLPQNIITHISGIGIYYPDGKETQRVGIVPDVFVEPTLHGFLNGRDEVIEKAVEIIRKKQ